MKHEGHEGLLEARCPRGPKLTGCDGEVGPLC